MQENNSGCTKKNVFYTQTKFFQIKKICALHKNISFIVKTFLVDFLF